MEALEYIIQHTKKNQADLYDHLLYAERMINKWGIKSVFSIFPNESFIAKYLSLKMSKVCLNSDPKHNKFESYDNFKFIDKEQENVVIRDYDLIHVNCVKNFNDWNLYAHRVVKSSTKLIFISNTKIDHNLTMPVVNAFMNKGFMIDNTIDSYYGFMGLTKSKDV